MPILLFLAALVVSSPSWGEDIFKLSNPNRKDLTDAWPRRDMPDDADRLILNLSGPWEKAELSGRIIALLKENPEPVREYILLRVLELEGGRHASVQPALEAILTRNEYPYPKQALLNAILFTSSDAHFLSLALLEARSLFLDEETYTRIMGNEKKWSDVPALLYHCVADGVTTDARDLEYIEPRDVPALDDLEYRNHCLYGLQAFPGMETLGYLERILKQHPALLGNDVLRNLRFHLARAIAAGDEAVIAEANRILLELLENPEITETVLRVNAVMGLSVPRNRSVAERVNALLAKESDLAVRKFLVQCLKLIQQNDYE